MKSFLRFILLFQLLAGALSTVNTHDYQYSNRILQDVPVSERCIAVGECEPCTQDKEGCGPKGRRKKFECVSEEGDRRQTYQSCNRSIDDEKWLVFRTEIICTILAVLSMMSTRNQKLKSASLFDLRRRHGGATALSSGFASDSDMSMSEDDSSVSSVSSCENEPLMPSAQV